ncbi:MAG TPA: signal peptidase I [Thermoanaerobaculia bacterium]|nr:signal peptidase I [Thermoanaerobaculia bacterium]
MSRPGRFAETAEAVLVAAALALFVKAFVFQIFHVPTASMEDTVLAGDRIVVDKFAYAPHAGPWARFLPYRSLTRGDVVVFRDPRDASRDLLKRAVATAGDRVEQRAKALRVNGVSRAEPYAVHRDGSTYGADAPPALAKRDTFGPAEVPEGRFFAMGDNRDDSQDSRTWGPAPAANLEGRAVCVLWSWAPPDRSFSGRGAALRRTLDTGLHFFARTRWNRTFRAVR